MAVARLLRVPDVRAPAARVLGATGAHRATRAVIRARNADSRGLRDCGEHAMLIVAALCVLVLSSFILSLVPCPGAAARRH